MELENNDLELYQTSKKFIITILIIISIKNLFDALVGGWLSSSRLLLTFF
jgi:hypothetical protein